MGRGKSSGGVEVRPNSIRISFTLNGERCRETLTLNGEPLAPTPANVKYARRVAAEIRDKIRHGTFSYHEYFPHSDAAAASSVPLLRDYLETWLNAVKPQLSPATLRTYRGKAKQWVAALGDERIDQIRHSQILQVLAGASDVTAKTRNNLLIVIRGAFDMATRDRIVDANPCDGIRNGRHQAPRPDPFTKDEMIAILRELHERHPEPIAALIQFKFFTGVRTGEALALSWSQVDLRANTVLIDRTLTDRALKMSTKTSQSRLVNLTRPARAAIDTMQRWTRLRGANVFCDASGEAMLDGRVVNDQHWRVVLKKLGIRYRDAYHTRHTFASLALMAGAKPGYVAKQLGHSVQVFFARYADWITGQDDAREADRINATIDEAFAPGGSPKTGSA